MNFKSIALLLVMTIAVFVGGALLMNYVVMPLFVHQRTSVIVPDVRAVSEQQARRYTERLSLRLQVERSQNDAEIP